MPRQHPPSLPALPFFSGAQTLVFLIVRVRLHLNVSAEPFPGLDALGLWDTPRWHGMAWSVPPLLLSTPSVTQRWDEPPCNLYPNASVQAGMARDEMVTDGTLTGNNKTLQLSRRFTALSSA